MRHNYDDLRVDRYSDVPLFVQLAINLGLAIRNGWWQANQALPSERMLSGWLKLSRVTTRRSYDVLVQEGLVYRRRGSGAYVKQSYEQPLGRLLGFTELFQERGLSPKSVWLSREITLPTADEAMKLSIGLNVPIVRLKRKRVVENQIVAYEVSALPSSVVPEPDKIDKSLYAYLSDVNVQLIRAHQHIQAMNATEEVAKYCRIPIGQAVLQVIRIGFNQDNKIVEYSTTYCRSDVYDFTIELNRHM